MRQAHFALVTESRQQALTGVALRRAGIFRRVAMPLGNGEAIGGNGAEAVGDDVDVAAPTIGRMSNGGENQQLMAEIEGMLAARVHGHRGARKFSRNDRRQSCCPFAGGKNGSA